ncbi:MAG: lipocalin family protein [Rikenellaceae bacterium]
MLKTILSTFFISLFCSCAAQGINNSTVEEFNLSRFLGEWYEIARFDSRFERNLVSVTANYTLNADGTIKVINRGYNTRKERWGESEGKAHTTDDAGRLRVSFFPMVYSDYNILMVGEDYQWALVGSSSSDYLWILSRSPEMQSSTLDHIITVAESRGYDTSKLLIL